VCALELLWLLANASVDTRIRGGGARVSTYPNAIYTLRQLTRVLRVFRPKLGRVVLSVHVIHLAEVLRVADVLIIVIIVAISIHRRTGYTRGAVVLARLFPARLTLLVTEGSEPDSASSLEGTQVAEVELPGAALERRRSRLLGRGDDAHLLQLTCDLRISITALSRYHKRK